MVQFLHGTSVGFDISSWCAPLRSHSLLNAISSQGQEVDIASDQSQGDGENMYRIRGNDSRSQSQGRSANGSGQSQGDGEDEESGEETNAEQPQTWGFDTASNVYEREKYPSKKRRKDESGAYARPPSENQDSGNDADEESQSGPSGGKKLRAAIYRHSTGSAYHLNTMYGQLRGSRRNAVMGKYKPVVDGSRTPPAVERETEPVTPRGSTGQDDVPKKKGPEKRHVKSNEQNGSRQPVGMNRKRQDSESEKLAEMVEREILDTKAIDVKWEDIAGLGRVKKIIQEIVIWPMLRPELFTGLRSLPRGLLLFGPPGTGKTTLGRCIASQAKATFYCISASSLTSKWVGENEKLVRALFESARVHQPAVVFIDEIDALLSNRVDGEHDSTRRLKTQFFTELDGAKTFEEERVLVVGATNRPGDLDDAARRRLTKRLYVPLPDLSGRVEMLENLLKRESHSLTPGDVMSIGERTDGFSCDDLKKMCQEAALGPVRRIMDIISVSTDQLPPISMEDFETALQSVRPSVSKEQLAQYEEFDRRYGSAGTGAGV